MARSFTRQAVLLAFLLVPLPLFAQAQPAAAPVAPAAAVKAPASWADEIIKKEGYVTPPAELAEAVLAPRHQVVSLANPSPDKKWFLSQVGDGPVPMTIFSKAIPRAWRRVRRLQGEPRSIAHHQQRRGHPGRSRRRTGRRRP